MECKNKLIEFNVSIFKLHDILIQDKKKNDNDTKTAR